MTQNWILWQTAATDEWQWCLPGSDGRFTYPVQSGNLATAANMIGDHPTCLLLRTEQLVLTETTINARNQRQVAAALPYLLEEQLADPPDHLHLASRPGKEKRSHQVAIINRQLLTSLLTQITNPGIRLVGVFADVQAVPLKNNSLTVVIDANRALLRSADGLGFAAPVGIAASLMKQQRQADQATPATGYTSDEVDASTAQLLEAINLKPDECQPVNQPLELLARGLQPLSAINLLQGSFKSFISRPAAKFPLLSLVLVLILLTGLAATSWLGLQHQQRRLISADQQIEQIYQHHFGRSAPPGDFRQDALTRLAELRPSTRETAEFIQQLAGIIQHLPNQLSLEQIEYNRPELKLLIRSPDLTTADQLRKNLETAGITSFIEITERNSDQVLLTLTVGKR